MTFFRIMEKENTHVFTCGLTLSAVILGIDTRILGATEGERALTMDAVLHFNAHSPHFGDYYLAFFQHGFIQQFMLYWDCVNLKY